MRDEDGFPPDEPAREINCHWRARIDNLLPKPADTWWSVRSDAPASRIAALGNTIAGHLADRAVPKLELMASDEAILATVLAIVVLVWLGKLAARVGGDAAIKREAEG